MRYTFGDAKRLLAPYASAYGMLDIGHAINTAIDELSRTRNWKRLTRLVRFSVTSEFFALPQSCGAILRANVDHTPTMIHSTEYEFLSGGPGDLDLRVCRAVPINGLQLLGVYPTMSDLARPGPLAAFSTKPPQGPLRVRGLDSSGQMVVASVPINEWPEGSDVATHDFDEAMTTSITWSEVTAVTMPVDGSAYVTLVAFGPSFTESPQVLAKYHPKYAIPEFTRYRLPGLRLPETGAKMLAEVAAKFLPLANDDDPLPFDSLLPVQFMMQSIRAMDVGEVEAADKYRERASALLIGREDVDHEYQGPRVVNMNKDLLPGAVSDLYANI